MTRFLASFSPRPPPILLKFGMVSEQMVLFDLRWKPRLLSVHSVNPFYTIYAPVRSYRMLPDTHPCVFTGVSRCSASNHRVFAILNKLITHRPLLLSERGSILFLLHGGRHFLYSIWVSLKCFPRVVSWSNIEWFTNGGRRCFGQRR